ncbi:MAG TPA: NAD(P)-dependent oxidoreductase [Edaphobacter sp.]|jgi:nucleoside-diphosphate-sugar epimerase|nr:NAD(P)-dependent oxidoreductase [Edaphobacter sp.]
MSEPLRRRRILVTGGTGTLGYNILSQLAAVADYAVIAPVRNMHRVGEELRGKVQFIEHELGDPIHTAQIFERANPDVIVHCAASGLRLPRTSWFDLMQFNVESTMRLFQMNCRFDHHSHFIYVSTGLVYREQAHPLVETDPIETLHPYGASKAAGDALLQAAAAEFQRPLTILRPFAFTGLHDGGERLFPRILNATDNGEAMAMTAGTQIRDFCSVDDIARAVLMVIERKSENLIEKFNLGSGRSLPLRELVTEVCSDLGIRPELRFGEVSMHPYEPHHSVANITSARNTLGWEPRHRLSHAVWELARQTHPNLICNEPERDAQLL